MYTSFFHFKYEPVILVPLVVIRPSGSPKLVIIMVHLSCFNDHQNVQHYGLMKTLLFFKEFPACCMTNQPTPNYLVITHARFLPLPIFLHVPKRNSNLPPPLPLTQSSIKPHMRPGISL